MLSAPASVENEVGTWKTLRTRVWHTHTQQAGIGAKTKRWRTDLFLSKTACARAGHALFGRIVGPVLLPQRWRYGVEKCMYRWRGVWKLSRKERGVEHAEADQTAAD